MAPAKIARNGRLVLILLCKVGNRRLPTQPASCGADSVPWLNGADGFRPVRGFGPPAGWGGLSGTATLSLLLKIVYEVPS